MDKRKLAAVLALGGAVAFGSLFIGGDEPIGGSYRGGYYGSAGSVAQVVVEPVVEKMIVFTIDPDFVGHQHPEFDAIIAAADSVVDLSDPANGFAFAMIDTFLPYHRVSQLDINAWLRTTITASQGSPERWDMNKKNTDTGRRHLLVRIPVENYIPPGFQVTSAIFKQTFSGTTLMGNADSLCVTLMTNPNDNIWYTSVGTTGPSVGQTRYAHATWRVQTAGIGPTDNYPTTDAGEWNPHWNERRWFWEIGDYSDWTGNPDGAGDPVQFDTIDIEATDCTQAAVNRVVNNGYCFSYSDWGSGSDQVLMYSWEATGAGEPYMPFFVVKYLTKPYVAPWPGGDFAFSIHTDDSRFKINQLLVDSLSVREGGRFTAFVTGGLFSVSGNPTYFQPDDLIAAHASGVLEVGSHSIYHTATGVYGYDADDLVIQDYTRAMYPDSLPGGHTQYDRLLFDTDPEFLYFMADAEGVDLREDPLWGKIFGVPVGNHSPAAQMAFAFHGYDVVRVLAVSNTVFDSDGKQDFRAVADRRPADADTAYSGIRANRPLDPQNLQMLANSRGVDAFVGDKTDFFSEAQVKLNVKSFIENLRAKDRGYFSFLLHDVKTGEDGAAYTTGLDPDEAGWMFDVVDEYNDPYVFVGEAGRWRRHWSTPIATPPAYAIDDSFKFATDDSIWGVLDGQDGRYIRGVR